MQEIVNIIEQKRQNLVSQLSKDIAIITFTNNLTADIQNWTEIFKEGLVSCTDSINLNLGPALNSSFQSEEEMLTTIQEAFDKTSSESDKLINLLHYVKSCYSDDNEENEVIKAMCDAIERVLKDLLFIYMDIEDAFRHGHNSGQSSFNPDISIPFAVINNYFEKKTNQLEEYNQINDQENMSKSEKNSWFTPIVAGIGLGFLLGDDDSD